ncbi:MAG: DUF3515 family protein [Pseudolysinimonas sp.]|uniref:DUF3515 family protein n=1 Tax=Pseudolysinimonas sp. TaxID=2680009 RepID=UPI0032649A0B
MTARRPLLILATLTLLAVLAGCTPILTLEPAADANNPGCADAIVHMPKTVDVYALRQTNAQATAAWGDPAIALLFCGVPVPAASDLPCVEVNGIQWLREEVPRDDGTTDLAFTSYGRDPAARVVVDTSTIGPGIVLDEVALAVANLPTNGKVCTSLEDTVSGSDVNGIVGGDSTPTPTPTPTP